MASITICNLDESLEARLRLQAAMHGRSMEDEARDILRVALNQQPVPPANLAAAIRARFVPLGGVELPESPREPMSRPPDLGDESPPTHRTAGSVSSTPREESS